MDCRFSWEVYLRGGSRWIWHSEPGTKREGESENLRWKKIKINIYLGGYRVHGGVNRKRMRAIEEEEEELRPKRHTFEVLVHMAKRTGDECDREREREREKIRLRRRLSWTWRSKQTRSA